jgi:hypothetical protein
VDPNIPPNPTQPDGTPFDPGGTPFQIIAVARNPVSGAVTLTWTSGANATYAVDASTTLATGSWNLRADNIPSGGATTTYTDNTAPPGALHYRVRRK